MTSDSTILTDRDRQKIFYPLLSYLDKQPSTGEQPLEEDWQNWHIKQISGGRNNLLYRVRHERDQFAVKFTIRDARDRAGREYYTLLALQKAGLEIAPQPILLSRDRFSQPVVVQTWLEGAVSSEPPQSDAGWRSLVQHYALIGALSPNGTKINLPEAVVNFRSAQAGLTLIKAQTDLVPATERPSSLQKLLQQLETTSFPSWPEPPHTLCRVDPNILNFVQRPGLWGSVDWENSGWGDPAFEIADLMAHPAYAAISQSRWDWVTETYCGLVDDPASARRIRVYYCLMLGWWVARLARLLYEVPRGRDERLVSRPDRWQADVEAMYRRYLALAWQVSRQKRGTF